jgi:predicted glycoside hydrolase/deacetylase ChbG (UPF0249 family)
MAVLFLFAAVFPVLGAASGSTVAERLGHPADAKLLIIHADDLGGMRTINRATFEALENGWVTSASILVPCPWFPDVVRWAREHSEADLGLHLALNSEWTGYRWGPVAPGDAVPSLLDDAGYLPLLTEAVNRRAHPAEIERELRAQIERALGAGIQPTHFDSHMGALFGAPEFFAIYERLGRRHNVPVLVARADRVPPEAGQARDPAILIDRILSISPGVSPAPDTWVAAYQAMLQPLGPGVYQLIVHLGYDDEELRGATWDHPNWGAAWRQADLDLVRSDAWRDFLREQGFRLITWRELAQALPADYGTAARGM